VLWMGIIYIGLNTYAAWRYGFRPNSDLAHCLGAAFGIVLGVVSLKRRWIDCDGYDLFSVMSGSYLKSNAARRVRPAGPAVLDVSHGDAASSTGAAAFVQQQKIAGQELATETEDSALTEYKNAVKSSRMGQLSEPELIHHADRLCSDGYETEAVPLLEEYLSRFEKRANVARLKLAEILIKTQQRPQYGLRILNELPTAPLKPRYEKLRQVLTHKAHEMIDDGVLELSGRAW
jgi:hypothetical protein